jgi:hypothetical protein
MPIGDEVEYDEIRDASMKQLADELRKEQTRNAEYIEMLQTIKEPKPKHTKLHYDWFKYNLYKLGHLMLD